VCVCVGGVITQAGAKFFTIFLQFRHTRVSLSLLPQDDDLGQVIRPTKRPLTSATEETASKRPKNETTGTTQVQGVSVLVLGYSRLDYMLITIHFA
jgi:hypothetical protein